MDAKKLKKLSQLLVSLKLKVKCPICLDPMQASVELKCSHTFCKNCFNQVKSGGLNCPICKQPFGKRPLIFKDQFKDDLCIFTNKVCQLVKEKYGCEVDELVHKTVDDLQIVMDTARKDNVASTSRAIEESIIQPTDVELKEFQVDLRRCYVNKKKQDKSNKPTVPQCNNDVKEKILNWLNNSHKTIDSATQNVPSNEEVDFDMPSVSQAIGLSKKNGKHRTQSLDLEKILPDPLLRRYQSLTEGLSDQDNYNIDEDNSEAVVKVIERKVLQDMLEDQYLDQLELEMKGNNETSAKKKSKKSLKRHSSNSNNSASSSNWCNLKHIKKSLNKPTKPAKLDIVIQESGSKISPGKNGNTSSTASKKGKPKMSPNKSSPQKHNHLKEKPAIQSEVQHRRKSTISDQKQDDMECIWDMATQKSANNIFSHITSAPSNTSSPYELASLLKENLTSCISNTEQVQTVTSSELLQCLTTLATYVERIIQSKPVQITATVQTVNRNSSSSLNQATQTVKTHVKSLGVQASPDIKPTLNKFVQTKSKQWHVEVQCDKVELEEQGVQTDTVEVIELDSSDCEARKEQEKSGKSDEKLFDSVNNKVSCVRAEGSGSNSFDELSDKSNRKVRKKLQYEEVARKGKRVRRISSDSDSENDQNPSKKKFIKSDLTIKFVDSESSTMSQNCNKPAMDADCEIVDYDKYLLEVMDRYDPSPKRQKPNDCKEKVQEVETVRDANKLLEERLDTESDLVEDTPIEIPKNRNQRTTIDVDRVLKQATAESQKFTDDIANMLQDIQDDQDFFNTNILTGSTGNAMGGVRDQLNAENVNMDDEPDAEKELHPMQLSPTEELETNNSKICILQNIVINSIYDANTEPENSDEEIVENTPQKKRSFAETSLPKALLEANDVLDVCLPPPPGFEDNGQTESPKVANIEENKENITSLTLDRLTDFLVTPDTKNAFSERAPPKGLTCTEDTFSPIARSSIKITQARFTPPSSNSKSTSKKYNLMTSTPNQKSILNYVVSSSSQEKSKPKPQDVKPCVMWSRIIHKDISVFTQLECKKMITTSKTFTSQVTHLVVLVDEKGQIQSHTAKILQAIAAGIWVVRYEWAQDCLRMHKIVQEEPYEVLDVTGAPGPQRARLTRISKPLFNGYKFYCATPFTAVSKQDLEGIVNLLGGKVVHDLDAMLKSDGNIGIILTDSSATEDVDRFDDYFETYKTVTVDVEWLSCCIGQYKLTSFRPFLVSGDESLICDLGYPPNLIESVPYTLTEGL